MKRKEKVNEEIRRQKIEEEKKIIKDRQQSKIMYQWKPVQKKTK